MVKSKDKPAQDEVRESDGIDMNDADSPAGVAVSRALGMALPDDEQPAPEGEGKSE